MHSKIEQLIAQIGTKPKLLIADDVPANIIMLGELFQDTCQVYMALDGEKAFEIAMDVLPDLILLDINMPKMDGHQLIKKLKNTPATSDIPTIFLTGNNDIESEENAFDEGAVDFITKPIHAKVTKARVFTHLVNKLQSDLLRRATLLDGLTGLYNRLGLNKYLEVFYLDCFREKRPISVLMIDVDFFKRYNDHFGHLQGDECLKQVAQSLNLSVKRPRDIVSRFGGEEFCCVLSNCDLFAAELVASRMCEEIRQLALPHPDSEAAEVVTISIGVASTIPESRQDADKLVGKADEMLYLAKKAGRNSFYSNR
ncbi:diguanylate cyclase [Leeia sp. TBRC 13508]|uniref:diguanylate cyclase n=1 Tax=Leeia speluncae TaxID=2884804 RepID=A0ABS8D7P7_9NEIS|nr:diguanylate cyclase [Leeia speluncae]MCB6184207.1 diguanylate cyclase [Leeia speluncae]